MTNKKSEVRERENKIFDYLKRKGYSDSQISAIIGNMHVETGYNLNPSERQDYGKGKTYRKGESVPEKEWFLNPKQGGRGTGLIQWDGPRRNALKKFAEKRGKKWDDLYVQLDFLDKEIKQGGIKFTDVGTRGIPEKDLNRSARWTKRPDKERRDKLFELKNKKRSYKGTELSEDVLSAPTDIELNTMSFDRYIENSGKPKLFNKDGGEEGTRIQEAKEVFKRRQGILEDRRYESASDQYRKEHLLIDKIKERIKAKENRKKFTPEGY